MHTAPGEGVAEAAGLPRLLVWHARVATVVAEHTHGPRGPKLCALQAHYACRNTEREKGWKRDAIEPHGGWPTTVAVC